MREAATRAGPQPAPEAGGHDVGFRAVADEAPVLVWVSDAGGAGLWFNRTWLQFTGRTTEEERGVGWRDGVHPDDRARHDRVHAEAFASREPFEVEYRLRRHDGVHRLVLERARPHYDEWDAFAGFVGTCIDITDQRRALETARRRARRQGAVADLGRRALEVRDTDALVAHAMQVVAQVLDADLVDLLGHRPADGRLVALGGLGWTERDALRSVDDLPSTSLAGYVLSVGRAIVVPDLEAERRFTMPPYVRAHGPRSAVAALVRQPRRPYGVVVAFSRQPGHFDDDDVVFMRSIANMLGATLARNRVERELLERELQARLAMDAGRMGSWRWDVETGAVWWSEELEIVYGLEPGTFGGGFDDYLAAVHPDDRDRVRATIERASSSFDELGFEHRVVLPDGRVRWLDARGRPVMEADGSVRHWIGVGIDVTERAEARLRLAESELRLRLALDAGRLGVWEWDRRARATQISGATQEIFGTEDAGFPGRWSELVHRIHEDDRERIRDATTLMVERGTDFHEEFRVVQNDGTVRWLEGRGSPLPATDGAPHRWIGVVQDVTARKSAEEERRELLRRAERDRRAAELEAAAHAQTVARLDTLLDNTPLGFAFLDQDLRFVRVNEALAAVNGLPVDAHLGRTIAEALPSLWPLVRDAIERVRRTGEAVLDLDVSWQTPTTPGVERYFLASYYPVVADGGEQVGIGTVVVDITESKRAERAARMIATASELFASVDEGTELLERVTRLPVPQLCDVCCVVLRGGRGARPVVEVTGVEDRPGPDAADALLETLVTLGGPNGPGATTVTGDAAADAFITLLGKPPDGHLDAIAAPLRSGGRIVGGVLLAQTHSDRVFLADDVELVEELARRLAQTLVNARLAAQAQRAHERLDLLAKTGEMLAVELDSHARFDAFAELVVPAFADLCAVYLRSGSHFHLAGVFAAEGVADGAGELRLRAHEEARVPLEVPIPAAEAIRHNRPVRADLDPGRIRAMIEVSIPPGRARERVEASALGVMSVLSVPLPGADGPVGAITFAATSPARRFDDADVQLAVELARRVAPAVDNARRFERQQATAETLQRSLLPESLPRLANLDLAVRYVPGSEDVRVGGDWYDAIPLPDGRVAVAIGDVAGHGVRAAATMGRLRNLLQFCALDGLPPAEILARLNRFYSALSDHDMATLLVALVDPSGEVRYSVAGHPPALIGSVDGAVRRLEGGRGMPLCASPLARYEEAVAHLAPQETLVLYTDGLVERRREPLDTGIERLEHALAGAGGDLDHVADSLLAAMLGGERGSDDVALLLLRPRGIDTRLWIELDAQPRVLGAMRRAVRDLFGRAGVAERVGEELVVALNEVAANAVEHAYGLDDARFTLEVVVEEDEVRVTVSDSGRWRARRSQGYRGRGLGLARSLVDQLDLDAGPEGTTVRLLRRLAPEIGPGRGRT